MMMEPFWAVSFPRGEVHLHCRHAAGEITRCLIARALNENCVASGKREEGGEKLLSGRGGAAGLSMLLPLKVLEELQH